MGAIATMMLTLAAKVCCRAVFSVQKYKVPPKMPSSRKVSSPLPCHGSGRGRSSHSTK